MPWVPEGDGVTLVAVGVAVAARVICPEVRKRKQTSSMQSGQINLFIDITQNSKG